MAILLVDWMVAVLRFAAVASVCPPIVPRDEWGAKLPKAVSQMANPVSTVVVHHTFEPGHCATAALCEKDMRNIQKFHQDTRQWDDIGYSFAVGGDGRVYKGRGWNRVGAHSPPYNFDSIGITLIGDWTNEAPPKQMLDALQWLIKCGVDTGRIAPDYQLIGHRQARDTSCPGDALFAVVKTWDHWTEKPAPPRHTKPVGVPCSSNEHADDDRTTTTTSTSEAAPAAATGVYDPATPQAGRDAVEVRQLDRRSLLERLGVVGEAEAARTSKQESLAPGNS